MEGESFTIYNVNLSEKSERKTESVDERAKGGRYFEQGILWGALIVITAVQVTLCFDTGLDLDEAYSYLTMLGDGLVSICRDILGAQDTDVPLYYYGLHLWTRLFGESFLSCRLYSVAGTVASLTLGATAIRRLWGFRTALLFMLFTGLSPAMIHVGVNIRMYSWTIFLVVLCALIIYRLTEESGRRRDWLLLSALTFAGLFHHYFTAFSFLFLYLYLVLALLFKRPGDLWKGIVCGGLPLVPTAAWFAASGILRFAGGEGGGSNSGKVDFGLFFDFLFRTRLEHSVLLGTGLFFLSAAVLIFFGKKFERRTWWFAAMCLGMMPCSYAVAGAVAALGSHFFLPRHVMHGLGLLWLAMAILLSRVNLPAYAGSLLFAIAMSVSSYQVEYELAYGTTPYLEETLAFIEERIKPGDVVIYNAAERFHMLYRCYMPEQEFYCLEEIDDFSRILEEHEGAGLWFFKCREDWFSPETAEQFGITQENMGHYGFQIMGSEADFDILLLDTAY